MILSTSDMTKQIQRKFKFALHFFSLENHLQSVFFLFEITTF